MTFPEILDRFLNDIRSQYGCTGDSITKIAMHPRLFNDVIRETMHHAIITQDFLTMSEPQILGVQLFARTRDKF